MTTILEFLLLLPYPLQGPHDVNLLVAHGQTLTLPHHHLARQHLAALVVILAVDLQIISSISIFLELI